jgi:hypothetical protein
MGILLKWSVQFLYSLLDVLSTTHQNVHFGLSKALISGALALISNYKCIA